MSVSSHPNLLAQFCFPEKVILRKEKTEARVHHLVLTDDKSQRLYVSCLISDEPVAKCIDGTVPSLSLSLAFSSLIFLASCRSHRVVYPVSTRRSVRTAMSEHRL
jgi:hypothetical protein